MEIQLLCLTFATGLQDAITFIDFRCLHSAQTGNTVLLGVYAVLVDPTSYRPAIGNAATSLGCFFVGAYLTGQVGAIVGHRTRAWQFGVGILQACMLLGAALIQYTHVVQEHGVWSCVAIGLLAAQSGSQIAAARAWNIPEITTAMATAAWVDLARDERLLCWRNRSRNRRVLFFITLYAGCIIGAVVRLVIGAANTLVFSLGVKVSVHLSMLFVKADDTDKDGNVLSL